MNGSILALGLIGALAAREAAREAARGSRDTLLRAPDLSLTLHEEEAVHAVRNVLTPDLLKPAYRAKQRTPTAGHCAVATESLYHMLGGKAAGYTPMQLQHEGVSHWFLRAPDGHILDATADQFMTPVPYDQGIARGFMTPKHGRRTQPPSLRAQVVIDRVRDSQSRDRT